MAISTRIICSLLLGLICQGALAVPLEPVNLQLKWRHQFQFAGYYAAKEKGFYRDVGLDVNIIEAQPGIDPIEQVIHGKADFGVGTSELILDRAEGSPVVVLGVVFQHSPLNLVTLASSGIDNIHKLAGKEVMIEHSSAELFAYLRCEGFTKRAINIRDHSFSTSDLISKSVDAMSVYVTDEPFELKKANINYNLFTPRMCGIDFYGDNFFTLESTVTNSPKTVEAFRAATAKGWRYAMDNVDELIEIIHSKYSERHDVDHLRYEARMMRGLMEPELIEPGYMNQGRWQHIAETYQSLGLLDEDFSVSDMIYVNPNYGQVQRLKTALLIGAGILILALVILFTISYFYRQVKASGNRFRTMFEHAPFGMIVLDDSHRIQSWNNQAERTFLWKQDEVMGKDVVETIVPKFIHQQIRDVLNRVLSDSMAVRSENPNFRKDGEEIICEWMNAPFKDNHNENRYIVSMARDITERKRLETELDRAAHYDGLTAIANRRLILDLFRGAIANAQRTEGLLGVLFIDLNDFKKINDDYGHSIGDEVLITIAERLKQAVRDSDFVGRLAGDEFLMILQNISDRNDAVAVSDKVAALIAEPCHVENHLINTSASIGISIYPDDSKDLDELITHSDKNMYLQKAQHKSLQ
ncbi:MAG: ABC transporter substrate-binding protein [Pseudomonadales bacterium]|nr:ABC transporter substrate-binding protein [Pseudomonadales bacterium]